MAEYTYKAVSPEGKTVNRKIEANSLDRATDKLKNEGYTILNIKEAGAMNKDININIGGKVTSKDLSVFCKQFSSILNAGVPVIQVIDMLAEQTENKTFKQTLKEVQASVEKGSSLADSMKMHRKIFPEIMINMTAAGEASGSMEVAFVRLAEHFEKDNHLKQQIKSAMIYPIMVLAVTIIVVIVMLIVVIPNFTTMFNDMGTELPAITQAVVSASDFVKTKWWLLIMIVAGIVFAVKAFKATPTGTKLFATLGIKIPIFGDLTVKSAAARYARTLSTLLASGIPLIDAIEGVAKVMTNSVIRKGMMNARDQVAKGVPLSKPLKEMGVFPILLPQMTNIGEETGNLEGMMEKVAEYFDEEVDEATKRLTAAMEPIIIVVLAGVVGTIVAAVMSPMFAMYENMDKL